jgi:uncharacterized protein (TIGR03067 family)
MPTDLDKVQGTWRVKSLEIDGKRMTAASLRGATMTISSGRFTSIGMGAVYEGEVRLHTATRPKGFDLLFTAGPEKGNRNLGIYELDGNRWTICLDTRGSSRPRGFVTKGASGVALQTLEREKGTPGRATRQTQPTRRTRSSAGRSAAATQSAAAGAATILEGEWTMVAGVFNGKALGADMVKWCRRITRGDVTTVVAGPQTMLKARFTLDRSADPDAIEYMNLEGASAGRAQSGIFDLSGETLRICMAPPGERRPADFSSKAGDGRSYTTWRLAK